MSAPNQASVMDFEPGQTVRLVPDRALTRTRRLLVDEVGTVEGRGKTFVFTRWPGGRCLACLPRELVAA